MLALMHPLGLSRMGPISHSPRSQHDRTRREDRYFKFYAGVSAAAPAARGSSAITL